MFFPNTTCMSHKALHCCTHFEKNQDVCLCVRVCVCVCALAHTYVLYVLNFDNMYM